MDAVENREAGKNYDAKKVTYSSVFTDGYRICVVSLPDTMLFAQTIKIMEAGFKRVLLETRNLGLKLG